MNEERNMIKASRKLRDKASIIDGIARILGLYQCCMESEDNMEMTLTREGVIDFFYGIEIQLSEISEWLSVLADKIEDNEIKKS